MNRICVIGDSHIAPLLFVFRQKEFPRQLYELTTFTCHINLISALRLEGSKLLPGTDELRKKLQQFSRGRDHIDLDAYDRFIIIGHGFSIMVLLYLYRHFVSDSMPGPDAGKYLLSDAAFLEAGKAAASRSEAFRIAGLIRSVCGKPVTVVPAPNPGLGLAEEKIPHWYPPFHAALRHGDDAALAALFRTLCTRLGEAYRLTVIPPLPEVAANGIFNLLEYSELPEDPDAQPDTDLMNAMVHANDRYGPLLARVLFDAPTP